MWTLFKHAENQVVAEMWRELLESGTRFGVLPIPDVMWRERTHAPLELLAS